MAPSVPLVHTEYDMNLAEQKDSPRSARETPQKRRTPFKETQFFPNPRRTPAATFRSLEAMKIPGSVALVVVVAGAPQGVTGFTVSTAGLREAGAGARNAGNMRMAGEDGHTYVQQWRAAGHGGELTIL